MAGFLTYGSGKALSYQHDYGKDIDRLYQRESYRAQVEAERARKSEYYASLMKQHAAATPFNVKRLEEFYSGLTGEVADFAMKHPKWNEDVMQSQQMFSIMDKFINNDIVREDIQVQAEFEKLKQAFNSGQITKTEYEDNAARYDKYKNEGGDPFVFANPKKVNFGEMIKSANDKLTGSTYDYTDPETGKITRTTKVSDDRIRTEVSILLSDPENRRSAEESYSRIDDKDKGVFSSLSEYMFYAIKNGEVVNQVHAGYDEIYQYNARKAIDAQAKNQGYASAFDVQILEPLARGEKITRPTKASIALSSWVRDDNIVVFGDKGIRGKKFHAYGKDGELGELTLIGSTKAVGSAGTKMVGDVLMVGTTVQVLFDPAEKSPYAATEKTYDKDQVSKRDERRSAREEERKRKEDEKNGILKEASNTHYINDLLDHGFVLNSEPGGMSSFGTRVEKGAVYTGTVWEPANIDAASRQEYDIAAGMTKSDVIESSELYSESRQVIKAATSLNIPLINKIASESTWKNPIDGKEYKGWVEDDGKLFNIQYIPEAGSHIMFSKDPASGKITANVIDLGE